MKHLFSIILFGALLILTSCSSSGSGKYTSHEQIDALYQQVKKERKEISNVKPYDRDREDSAMIAMTVKHYCECAAEINRDMVEAYKSHENKDEATLLQLHLMNTCQKIHKNYPEQIVQLKSVAGIEEECPGALEWEKRESDRISKIKITMSGI